MGSELVRRDRGTLRPERQDAESARPVRRAEQAPRAVGEPAAGRPALAPPSFGGRQASSRIRRTTLSVPPALDLDLDPAPSRIRRSVTVRPLSKGLRTGVEAVSGVSMSDVRVHYNSPEPARLGALAYAQGADIHVGPGEERHVPHEAWHVVQQAEGRVAAPGSSRHPVVSDAGLEREADAAAGSLADGPSAGRSATSGALIPVPTAPGAPAQLVRRELRGPPPPITLAVLEQAVRNHLEQVAELDAERNDGFWNDEESANLARWQQLLDQRIQAARNAIDANASFTIADVQQQVGAGSTEARNVVLTLGNMRQLLNAKHLQYTAYLNEQAEAKQYEYQEKDEYKAKNSDEAKEQRERERLLQERERIRQEKQAASANRKKGLGNKWGVHNASLKRAKQVMFAQHVPAGAATITNALRSQNISDAVYHLDKAFWVADPSKFELGSANGKSRMEYTFTAEGARSLMEDYLICGSGDYLDDNEEPWAGETAHPYYTIWKANEVGAYGIGSERLKELAGKVQRIRAFDPEDKEIKI